MRAVLRGLTAWSVCMLFAAITPMAAMAQVSFSGQTIEWIIPFSPSGGSDTWARFNAPFLSRHLPGNPDIAIINEPGGGGTRGPNSFVNRAMPDGLTILGTSGSTQFPYLLGDLRVRYDYQDFDVVMVAPTGGVVYVSADTGVTGPESLHTLRDQRLVFASQGPTSLDLVPMLAFRLLGLDVRYVFGYAGRNDGLIAMSRGEVSIDYQTTASYLRNVAPLVERGEAVPLMSWGVMDENGRMQRDPTFPELPIVEEVYETLYGHPPSGADYDAYHAFSIAGFAAQKMVVLPKDTPDDIVEAWRKAWRDIFADPEYQSAVTGVLGSYDQVTDRAAEALFNAGTTIEPTVRRHVLDMLASEYSVHLGSR